jgi:hypothetical protein
MMMDLEKKRPCYILRYCYCIFLEGLRKTMIYQCSGVPSRIGTRHYPNTRQKRVSIFGKSLKRISGLERGEVTAEWRKLRNEGLRKLYPSPLIIRMMKLKRLT